MNVQICEEKKIDVLIHFDIILLQLIFLKYLILKIEIIIEANGLVCLVKEKCRIVLQLHIFTNLDYSSTGHFPYIDKVPTMS